MSKRILKIVESMEEYNKELYRKILADEIHKPLSNVVMTPEVFSKIFSPERIRLLQRVKRNKLENIYQLAKELGKPYEVVFRNIKYLEGMHLVKVTTKGKKKIPHLADFEIEMFGAQS